MFYHLNNHLEIFSDVPEYNFDYHLYPVLIYNLQLPSISKTFLLLGQNQSIKFVSHYSICNFNFKS